jgi:type I restriction enzyme S subunit
MIDGLKPYPAYKDSRLPWLGQVPEHWEIRRLKAAVSSVNEQTSERRSGDAYLALEHVESWTGRARPQLGDVAFDSQLKRFKAEDVLFGKLRPYLAKVARLPVNGVCVGEFLVLRSRSLSVLPSFLEKVLRSHSVIDVINSSTFGAKMPRADWDFVGNLLLAYPAREEQSAIVRFLDHADRRIRRYIHAKRRLIALLNEQKQAIIHRAITRGLDSNVRFKPSGVEWLGEVPEHWDIVPLKNTASIQSGLTLGKTYLGRELKGFPYLRVANVQDGHLDLSEVKTVFVPDEDASRCALQAGDVLMTEGGDPDKLGRGCVWKGAIDRCLHQNHVFAVRPNPHRLRPEFLAALLGSHYSKTYFIRRAKQTTNLASTNKTTIGQLPVLLPSLKEQNGILAAGEAEAAPVRQAMESAEREIDLLREYRTRLIADVVTGKLDVRAAAARLPDEPDEPEAPCEAEAPDEAEETPDDDSALDTDDGVDEA